MTRIYVFSDESGDLTLKPPGPGITRFFAVGTITLTEAGLGDLRSALARTRDHLAWHSHGLDSYFHASADSRSIRDAVFEALAPLPFGLDVTLLDKALVPIGEVPSDLFGRSWLHHIRRVGPTTFGEGDEVLITAAEIGVRRERAAFRRGIEDAIRTTMPYQIKRQLAFWPCASDFGLQAVDYALWAVCRYWERGDDTYRALIHNKIRSEMLVDANGNSVPKSTNPRPTRLVSQSPGALSSDGVAQSLG